MNYYEANSVIALLLAESIKRLQRVNPVPEIVKDVPCERHLDTSRVVLTKDMRDCNRSVVTAHVLNEFKPKKKNSSDSVLLLDKLIKV